MGFPFEASEGLPTEGEESTAVETGGQGNVHPAWNEALSAVPQEYHDALKPHFQKWDQNVQTVHQTYAPYRQFQQQGYTPDKISQALSVAQAIETNPQGFYEVLKQHLGQDAAEEVMEQQGLAGQQEEQEYAQLSPQMQAEFDRMRQGHETMAQILLDQRKKDQEAQEDAQLDALYKDMERTSPVFRELNKNRAAEPYINNLLMQGMQPQQAIKMFEQFVDQVGVRNNRPKPPTILSANGAPVAQQNRREVVKNMDDRQTKNLVADTLRAAFSQNQ